MNPHNAVGSQCRGACGIDCPSTCRAAPGTSTCLEWQTADCGWHAKVCSYTVRECGSHPGCVAHDACYDGCGGGLAGFFCRRDCDATCVATHGAGNCTSWWGGNGPYVEPWLKFVDPPTSSTYDSTCY